MNRLALAPVAFLLTFGLVSNGRATFGDLSGSYPYVGRTVYWKDGKVTQSATGVAIAPHWVITASHAGGSAFEQDGKVFKVDQRVYCPDADLLMLHTVEPMASYVPPAYAAFADLKGQRVVIVGTGQIGTKSSSGWTVANNPTGAVKAAANTIDDEATVPVKVDKYDGKPATDRNSKCLVYDLDDPQGGNGSTGGPAIANEGGQAGQDSGGAWLARVDGKLRLVAVCGYVAPSPSNPSGGNYGFGAVGLGIHLAPVKAWIEGNLAKN